MDTIQTNCHKQENRILKSNLWKFFKALRAQANPIYCLLVTSPISYVWITIIDKSDSTIQKRISIAQFVNAQKKLPSKYKYYLLSINLFSHTSEEHKGIFFSQTSDKHKGIYTYNAVSRDELSVDIVKTLWPDIVAYHCAEAIKRNERFELTPETIKRYKFKARYLDELKLLIEQCNAALEKETNSHL
jgi:hypothetical protein